MRKKVDHTTIRNSNLFCTHCGVEQLLPFSLQVEMMTAMITAFNKIHRNCQPTWKQPEANQNQSIDQRAQWWLTHGQRGISSETIWGRMTGRRIVKHGEDHPYDPDDFSRCYKLLKVI